MCYNRYMNVIGILYVRLAAILVLIGLPAQSQDLPPMVKSIKDWNGSCHNNGICFIETSCQSCEESSSYIVRISRSPIAWNPACISVFTETDNNTDEKLIFPKYSKPNWSLQIDGQTALSSCSVGVPLSQAVTNDFRLGKNATFSFFGNDTTTTKLPTTITFSLSGFTAAALWLDDRQNRVGTTTALAAPGPNPPVDGPKAHSLLGPDDLPDAVRDLWSQPSLNCTKASAKNFVEWGSIVADLDSHTKLYIIPCGAAKNRDILNEQSFVAIRQEAMNAPSFVNLPNANSSPILKNLSWDERNMVLFEISFSEMGPCSTRSWIYTNGDFDIYDGIENPYCQD